MGSSGNLHSNFAYFYLSMNYELAKEKKNLGKGSATADSRRASTSGVLFTTLGLLVPLESSRSFELRGRTGAVAFDQKAGVSN